MTDALKIAAKVALIAVVTTAILALFNSITLPGLDFNQFSRALGVGLAILYHYVPTTELLYPVVIALASLELAIKLFQFAMIGVRWVFKVNE